MTNITNNPNATTAKLGGKFSHVAVSEFQNPKVLDGTGWLVKAHLVRHGETIFICPELEYAGKGMFDPLYLKDDSGQEADDHPSGLTHSQLLQVKSLRENKRKEATAMEELLRQVSFPEMVGILSRKAHSFDYQLKKAVGGRFLLSGFDYPKKEEDLDMVFLGEKKGSFISVSSEEPDLPHEANQKWLIETIVGVHEGRVLIPIIPGKMAKGMDRLWKTGF
jgi:hypothetical protein